MSDIAIHPFERPTRSAPGLLARLRSAEPRFFAAAALMLAALGPTVFAAFLDQRSR